MLFETVDKETSLQIKKQKRKLEATSMLETSLHPKSKLAPVWQGSVKIILYISLKSGKTIVENNFCYILLTFSSPIL